MGGSQEGRMKKAKLATLLDALKYSEQAETVIKDGKEYRAILNKNKQKMDYDDKNISIPHDAEFKVGDVFHWVEDESDWIIYLKEGQDAYFTGICRKAAYNLRWKDEYNVYHSVKTSVRGPVETKIVSEMKSGLSFDSPNYTLYCIIPQNEETMKIKRYTKVSIDEKIWQVTVADAISEPGVIELQLLEHFKNRIEDEELLKPGSGSCEFVPDESIKILTSLDNVKELELDEPFRLWAKVEREGKEDEDIVKDAKFIISTNEGSITDGNLLTPLKTGKMEILVEIPKLCYSQPFTVDIVDKEMPPAVSYQIIGDDKVKSFGETEYTLSKYVDGIEAEAEEGRWTVEKNNKIFSIKQQGSNSLILKWNIGSSGKVKIGYTINDEVVAEKQIKVESLI